MSRSRSNSGNLKTTKSALTNASALKPEALPLPSTRVSERLFANVFGVKGSSLRPAQEFEENPMARLKLLLVRGHSHCDWIASRTKATVFPQIASFLTLHILNFCTTLTPATAVARHNTHSLRANVDYAPPAPRVDYTSPGIATVLASLAEVSTSASTDASLYVKIAPPVHVRVIPTPQPAQPTTSSSVFSSNIETTTENAGTGEVIENFMSSWTKLVGDPVMSKWIVVVLAISVTLNGFLLKGIAAGTGLPMRGSVRFRSRVGIKFNEKPDEEPCEPPKPAFIMPSIGPLVTEPAPITLEPIPASAPAPAPVVVDHPVKHPRLPILSMAVDLHTVDAKLEKERLLAEAVARSERARTEDTRTLSEIVDIFENGPRPVSASLSLLTDEEVVMLCQAGKIAAYALEKMLGDFERAVVIRRALICMFSFSPLWTVMYKN